MSHELKDSEYKPDEHLTDEEVEAIVKRYGESQSAVSTQPTVEDVAEALHVEPGVVAQLLSDVRGAKTEEDLKDRLNVLESENAELRVRAEKSDYETSQMWSDYSSRGRRGNHMPRYAAIAAIALAAMIVMRMMAGGSSLSVMPVVVALVLIGLSIRIFKRSRR